MAEIRLNNIYGVDQAIFILPTVYKHEHSNEIVQIIRHLSMDYSELTPILTNFTQSGKKTFECLKSLTDDFNAWVSNIKESRPNEIVKPDLGSSTLIKFMMQLIYNRAILDPGKLNHYEAFSPEVYGETSFSLIEKILERVELEENEIFMDLGSGVGNVVLHVAAAKKCKLCVGVEKAEWPAKYAENMEKEFKYWMGFFGKLYSEFKLLKGDFFSQEDFIEIEEARGDGMIEKRNLSIDSYVREIISASKLIFVNNYVFGAEVDHQLKLRFLEKAQGSLIVSSKPFCPLNFRINDRNLNDIGCILNVSEMDPVSGSVSWTPNPVNYYFHKIDHSLLEKYYEEKKKTSNRNKDEHLSKSSHSPHSTTSFNSSPTSTSSSSGMSSTFSSPDQESNAKSKKQSKKRDRSYSPIANKSEFVPSSHHKSGGSVSSKDSKKAKISKEKNLEKHSSKSSATTATTSKASSNKPKSHKKDKEKKKNKKTKKTGLDKIKQLNKGEKKTLDEMHNQAVKVSQRSSLTVNSKPSPQNSSCFNRSSLTTLKHENLDHKLLKDSKISSKLIKHINGNGVHRSSSNHSETSSKSTNVVSTMSKSKAEEKMARKEYGDDMIDSIKNYFEKCRQESIRYLLYLKSPAYKEKLSQQLQKEKSLKHEQLKKIETFERQNHALIGANANLLNIKAFELDLKDLNIPSDLFRMSKDIVNERNELERKLHKLNIFASALPAESIDKSRVKLLGTLIGETTINTGTINSEFIPELKQVNSVESTRSSATDETLTANDLDDDLDNVFSPKIIPHQSSNTNGSTDQNHHHHQSENREKNKHSSRIQNNIKSAYNNKPNPKSILDEIQTAKITKNFKIPKQSVTLSEGDTKMSLSSTSIDGDYSASSPLTAKIITGPIHIGSNNDTPNKSYNNYYHPKKRYMMESCISGSGSPPLQIPQLNTNNF